MKQFPPSVPFPFRQASTLMIALGFAFFFVPGLQAQTTQWTGDGADDLFSNDNNWDNDAPTSGVEVVFNPGHDGLVNDLHLGIDFNQVAQSGAAFFWNTGAGVDEDTSITFNLNTHTYSIASGTSTTVMRAKPDMVRTWTLRNGQVNVAGIRYYGHVNGNAVMDGTVGASPKVAKKAGLQIRMSLKGGDAMADRSSRT